VDRRARVAAGLAAIALAACGGPPAPRRAVGTDVRVLARGSLGYAVAFAGERPVSLELGEAFELVVRDEAGAERGRVALGPAERDWTVLAAAGDRAWAAGEAGEVVAVDLASATVAARWPVGAPVTALAASDELVAIGDVEGALCVRRADDGALLQCLAAHDGAIDRLVLAGDVVTSVGDDATRGWRLPDLREVAPGDEGSPLRITGARVDRVDADGPHLVVEMSGAVQDVARSPSGRIAVAAWITKLDQPSIVVVAPPASEPGARMVR